MFINRKIDYKNRIRSKKCISKILIKKKKYLTYLSKRPLRQQMAFYSRKGFVRIVISLFNKP